MMLFCKHPVLLYKQCGNKYLLGKSFDLMSLSDGTSCRPEIRNTALTLKFKEGNTPIS